MFALIFMAEYARIIFMRIIFSIFFVSQNRNLLILYIFSSIIISVWIWVRTTLPRYRYDKLINLAWKIYLPIVLRILVYSLIVSAYYFFNVIINNLYNLFSWYNIFIIYAIFFSNNHI
jgi:NADH-ubiquinone oxidoreductase chain 1